jgi:hypothetical protein
MTSRSLVLGLILILLVVFVFPPAFVRGSNVLIVPTPYGTIQAALAVAQPGDTIRVLQSYTAAGEVFPVTVTQFDGITITGDTDSNGNPLTTVDIANGVGTHNGFNIDRDNVIIQNLKIIDSGRLNDIPAVINAGIINPPSGHDQIRGSGLQINNVNINMLATGGFHATLGLQLFENNFVVNGVTIRGATQW